MFISVSWAEEYHLLEAHHRVENNVLAFFHVTEGLVDPKPALYLQFLSDSL